MLSLLSCSIAIRSAHDAARMSLAEALLQNNTGSFAEDGGLLQVTSTDVHSSELAVVALATPLDNWEQAKAATAYREEFERVCKRGGTTGEPEDSIRAVVSKFHPDSFFPFLSKARSLKRWAVGETILTAICYFLRGLPPLAGRSFYVRRARERGRL